MKKYLAVLLTANMPGIASANPDGSTLFNNRCSMCHSIDKKSLGPAVKSMNTDPEVLRTILAEGKNAMPGFSGKLSSAEIEALVEYLVANQ